MNYTVFGCLNTLKHLGVPEHLGLEEVVCFAQPRTGVKPNFYFYLNPKTYRERLLCTGY